MDDHVAIFGNPNMAKPALEPSHSHVCGSGPLAELSHGNTRLQELNNKVGGSGSTCTHLTHGLQVWVDMSMGMGKLKIACVLPMPLPS
jgi:hypothetical protein